MSETDDRDLDAVESIDHAAGVAFIEGHARDGRQDLEAQREVAHPHHAFGLEEQVGREIRRVEAEIPEWVHHQRSVSSPRLGRADVARMEILTLRIGIVAECPLRSAGSGSPGTGCGIPRSERAPWRCRWSRPGPRGMAKLVRGGVTV
jgi:hypothetical protein